jgi:hypothetical protein
MAVFSAETDGYKESLALIDTLKTMRIHACIAPGCVSIFCYPDQVPLIQQACKEQNALFRTGYIGKTQDLLLKSQDGVELLKKVQGNSQAIVNEWKDS